MEKKINAEIKARATRKKQEEIVHILRNKNAGFYQPLLQIDTYYEFPDGKQKIRKTYNENDRLIERELIQYERENKKDTKISKQVIYNLYKSPGLESTTKLTYKKIIEVEKKREVFCIENVKFHIDDVKDLGTFVEIEAQALMNKNGNPEMDVKDLKKQCDHYRHMFGISDDDLVSSSYSDMLLKKQSEKK